MYIQLGFSTTATYNKEIGEKYIYLEQGETMKKNIEDEQDKIRYNIYEQEKQELELQKIAHDLKIRLNTLLSSDKEEDRREAQKLEEQIQQIKYKQQQIKNYIDKLLFDEYQDRILNEKEYNQKLHDMYSTYNMDNLLKRDTRKVEIKKNQPEPEKIITNIVNAINPSIETQTDTLLNEIKQMYPSINKEELKQLIKRYPDLKDAINSSYIN